jgi:CheY-like chemotaxis protein
VTILIVEDNAAVRHLLCRAVAPVASSIWECADGDTALGVYVNCRPDVVLMDVRMPRIDGLTAMKQIRQFDPAARVVIVTAYDDGALRSAAQEAGSCAYVLKENLLDLAQIVSSVLAA